jgi:phosphate transport system substrate-binding protein
VHRSDGSGTTANFTAYLDEAAGSDWTLGTDKTVNWPASTIGAEKNTGVADKITSTDGAIGYVDFSDATAAGLTFAAIKNKDGNYVTASLDASSAALEGATLSPDVTYNPLNAAGAGSYPIVAPTFILVYEKYDNADAVTVLKALMDYVLGPGQDMAAELDFARLPAPVLDKAKAQLDKISA